MSARGLSRSLLVCAALAPGLGGCFLVPSLVGVTPAELDRTFEEVDRCALIGGKLSSASLEVLRYYDLVEAYEGDPLATLVLLHEHTVAEPYPEMLFALAETSYLAGKREEDRGAFLAAALYASAYLLDDAAPSPYDRRFRWACDLYGQGLLRAFLSEDGQRFEPREGTHRLPVGSLELTLDRSALPWPSEELRALLPADAFLIHGLRLRLRDSGLGVPLIGKLADEVNKPIGGNPQLLQVSEAPITAFLRVQGSPLGAGASVPAVLELYSGFAAESVDVGGREVPLETDRSVVLAHVLDRPEAWRFSVRGFFRGGAESSALGLFQPYVPGRVPVVFVHGTASSPAYWAELFNTLWYEPELRQRAQFWFFRYATGNPIAFSAAELRDALAEAVAALDPEGKDPALRQMVLIGHSQGGLLVKMLAVDGDLSWVEEALGAPIAEYGFDKDEVALLERCFEFEPSPYVSRTVFICTPHHGSFLSDKWYARLVASLVGIPNEIAAVGDRLFADEARLPKELRGSSLTSVSGMEPDNPLLARLVRTPLAPGVVANSIIAIGDADPADPAAVLAADDGVVAYTSAHVEDVASEDLVPAGHSCQSHPATIEALRRILIEHLRALP